MGCFPALWVLVILINVQSHQARWWGNEIECHSYRKLEDYSRNTKASSSYNRYCDSKLHGWYRFTGKAGDRLSQVCQSGYYGCGSYYRGWMSGSLPSRRDGIVQRKVYFGNYYSCYSQSTTIRVKNCGTFYVYHFKPTSLTCNFRYCGSHDETSSILPSPSATPISSASISPKPYGSGCYNYRLLDDYSRNKNAPYSDIEICDSKLQGWYRFTGRAGDRLLQKCITWYYGCGTSFRGWMSGSLPSRYEGAVERTVYFAQRYGSCYKQSTSIWVENCGYFYVYYFRKSSRGCKFRYCGSFGEVSSILPSPSATPVLSSSISPTPHETGCHSYNILVDYSRNTNYRVRYNHKCDSNLQGWYRFTGYAGDRISQKCQRGYYGCGSSYRGWMSGSLPSLYEGAVERTVYFAHRYGSCFTQSTSIWVENCGYFYVYYLKKNAVDCNYRYCGSDSEATSILPSPSATPVISTSILPVPQETGCFSYRRLDDYLRNTDFESFYLGSCDSNLQGWYRFYGHAGDRLSQQCLTGNYGCGSVYRGWMIGLLPSHHEGVVERTVYFASYYSCYSKSTTIWVENCGYFFVYFFKQNAVDCNYRYCGSDREVIPIVPSPSATPVLPTSTLSIPHETGCYSYTILDDYSRNTNYRVRYIQKCDSNLQGWYRFTGSAGDRLSQKCQRGYYGCGSSYRGWMSGSLPSLYEGAVERTVYFAHRYGSCFTQSTSVWVENCGYFYVYYFKKNAVFCNYRYCGSDSEATSILPSPSATPVISTSILPVPQETGCFSYRRLDDYSRNTGSHSSYLGYCDSNLQGWYRFYGHAGDRLSQQCQTGNYGCGSVYRGWMIGVLPSRYEGVVERTVYFASYYSCYSKSTTIWVENCGYFFVYYFKQSAVDCNYRFCGTDREVISIAPSPSATPVLPTSTLSIPHEDPCSSYQYLTDRSRHVHSVSYYTKCDAYLNGWYKFVDEAGTKLLNHCPQYSFSSRKLCGAKFQGWLKDSLPDWYDGAVSRTIYFARAGNCSAYQSKTWVKNCGGFYVYYFHHDHNIPCDYRYCGMDYTSYKTLNVQFSSLHATQISKETQSTAILKATPTIPNSDACKDYHVLSDPTRAHSYSQWYINKCDNHLHGWYRFKGQAGNRMQSSCSSQDRVHYRCGSMYQGWLLQPHPRPSDGDVYRMVCFSTHYSCLCQYQKMIKIRNCGSFYVYWLDGTPACSLRYCGTKGASDFLEKLY